MKNILALALGIVLMLGAGAAIAQTAPVPPGYSLIGGQTIVPATNGSSTRVVLPAAGIPFGAITIYNPGTVDAFFALGDVTIAATTSSIRVASGTSIVQWVGPNTYIAGITASGSANLIVYQATGPVYFAGGGGTGGGGGSGAITAPLGSQTAANSVAVTQNPAGAVITTMQSAAVANGNGTVMVTTGESSAVLTVNCASCAGGTTINFEGTEDGTNYAALSNAYQLGTSTISGTTTAAGISIWQISVAGLTNVRARISGYSAGTITITSHTVPTDWTPRIINVIGGLLDNVSKTGQTYSPISCANETTPTTGTNGNINYVRCDPRNRALSVELPNTTPIRKLVANNVTSVAICASACNLDSIDVYNITNTPAFVKLYNATQGATTCGSGTPVYEGVIPANSTLGAGYTLPNVRDYYPTALTSCTTTGIADADTGAPAANAYVENFHIY